MVAQAVSRYRQVGAPGQRLLLVTSEGRVIGADRNEMQIIRNFIGQADNADHPQKKKYGRVEMVGPFSVRDGEDNYQLYLIRPASSSQSDFINLLFDRPLLLLIVTMLVSSRCCYGWRGAWRNRRVS